MAQKNRAPSMATRFMEYSAAICHLPNQNFTALPSSRLGFPGLNSPLNVSIANSSVNANLL